MELKPTYQIAPSLLSADFARLGEEAQSVIDSGGDVLHLDAMDNHFVPNLTVGPMACAALRRYGIAVNINVHLMVQPVDRLIVDFAQAGASSITFHAEATDDISQTIALIHSLGCAAGLAIKPATQLLSLDDGLDQLDLILVMSVEPGFGGQPFIPETFGKIQQISELITLSGKQICLAVDGGIKVNNIAQVAKAGANRFVVGTAIFGQPNYAKVIAELRSEVTRGQHGSLT